MKYEFFAFAASIRSCFFSFAIFYLRRRIFMASKRDLCSPLYKNSQPFSSIELIESMLSLMLLEDSHASPSKLITCFSLITLTACNTDSSWSSRTSTRYPVWSSGRSFNNLLPISSRPDTCWLHRAWGGTIGGFELERLWLASLPFKNLYYSDNQLALSGNSSFLVNWWELIALFLISCDFLISLLPTRWFTSSYRSVYNAFGDRFSSWLFCSDFFLAADGSVMEV